MCMEIVEIIIYIGFYVGWLKVWVVFCFVKEVWNEDIFCKDKDEKIMF